MSGDGRERDAARAAMRGLWQAMASLPRHHPARAWYRETYAALERRFGPAPAEEEPERPSRPSWRRRFLAPLIAALAGIAVGAGTGMPTGSGDADSGEKIERLLDRAERAERERAEAKKQREELRQAIAEVGET